MNVHVSTVVNGDTLETIVKHFLIAAVWADAQEGTHPRIPRETRAEATLFVCSFLGAYPELCEAALKNDDYGTHPDAGSAAAAFGHDLFLSARGHGVGFWSRDELGDTGEALAAALRNEWRRWYLEVDQSRGWLYLMTANKEAQP